MRLGGSGGAACRPTVRGVAADWLGWLEQVRGAKPSTIRDYRTLLREPGEPYKRGKGVSRGLIMKTFGDRPAVDVSTKDVSGFLRSLDLGERLLLVRRNLSAGVETEPKGRRHRYVPLSDPALGALARLGARREFVGPDDYVVCNRWGRGLDASALRRRYHRACAEAGLRRVKLHGLRHAAGSILARTADPVFVRDYLGHAELSTTDRYVSAKHRPEGLERLNRAFAVARIDDPAPESVGVDG